MRGGGACGRDGLPGAEVSDEALCRRVAAGDDAAFDRLVERHGGRAYRLAWSLLRDAEEARDLSQEAFVRLYRTAGGFRGDARFTTWFYRILVNLCLDHRRRHRWWRRLVAGDGDTDGHGLLERQAALVAHPVEALGSAERAARLWAAVERLPGRQRAAVLLQVQEDLSTRQIAEVLKCSEATVRVHLHRALATLRRTVERD